MTQTKRASDPPRMSAAQTRKVKKLVRVLCANCDGGKCLLLDDGDPCLCPQLITSSLICKYFRNAVLPSDRELCADVFRERMTRRCRICGVPIFSASNAAKYCPSCAVKERRRRDVLRKRKQA